MSDTTSAPFVLPDRFQYLISMAKAIEVERGSSLEDLVEFNPPPIPPWGKKMCVLSGEILKIFCLELFLKKEIIPLCKKNLFDDLTAHEKSVHSDMHRDIDLCKNAFKVFVHHASGIDPEKMGPLLTCREGVVAEIDPIIALLMTMS